MNRLDEDAELRARKYITALTTALRKTNVKVVDTSVRAVDIHRVADAIERYLRDAEHFLADRRPSTSLASVAYGEGLLDALVFLNLTTDGVSE